MPRLPADNQQALIQSYERRMQGPRTFRVGKFAGKPAYWVGEKHFDTPGKAAEYINSVGLKGYALFDTTLSETSFPRVGAGQYVGIERLIRKLKAEARTNPELAKIVDTLQIHRFSYSGDNSTLRKVYENELFKLDRAGKRTAYGFQVPSDSGLTVLRMFSKGKELTSQTIEDLMEKAGYRFQVGKQLPKRLTNLINLEEFATIHDSPFKIHKLNVDSLFPALSPDARNVGFDGLSLGNPAILEDKLRKMEANAARLRSVGDETSASAIERKVVDLRSKLKTGDSFEAFRAYGLEGIEGMPKGDIYFPTKEGWDLATKKYGIKGPTDFIIGNADNITKQFGLTAGSPMSYFTLRLNEPNRYIRTDIESITAYPELHDVVDLVAHTKNIFEDRINTFMESGELPEDTRNYLEGIIQRSQESLELNKGETLPGLLDQQARAKRILAKADLGISPMEDATYAREFYHSQLEFMNNARRKGDPYFFTRGTIGAHIRHNEFALAAGIKEANIAEGELGFNRHYGLMMHPEDIARFHYLHGGFDLDDLLRAHLRLVGDEGEEGVLKAIGIRTPMAYGETSAMNVSEGSYGEIVHQLAKADPAVRAKLEYMKNKARIDQLDMEINKITTRLMGPNGPFDPTQIKNINNQIRSLTEEKTSLMELIGASPSDISEATASTYRAILHSSVPRMSRENFQVFETDLTHKGKIPVTKTPVYKDYDAWLAEKVRDFDPISSGKRFAAGDLNLDLIQGLTPLQRAMTEQEIAFSKVAGALGNYVNLNMLTDSLRGQIEARGVTGGLIPFTPTEYMLDVLTQGVPKGGVTLENAYERMSGQLYGLAEAVANEGYKLPRNLFETRMVEKNSMTKLFYEHLHKLNPSLDLESIFLDPTNPQEAAWDTDAMSRVAYKEDIMGWIRGEASRSFGRKIRLPENIEKEVFTSEEVYQASRLAETARLATDKLRSQTYHVDWREPWMFDALKGNEALSKSLGSTHALHVMATDFFDESGEFGERGMRVMGAFMQQYGKDYPGNLTFRFGFSDLATKTEAYYATKGWTQMPDDPKLRTFYESQRDLKITRDQLLGNVDTTLDPAILDREVISNIEGGLAPGAIRNKALRESSEYADSIVDVAKTEWRDINMSEVKRLFSEPLARKAGIGAIALVAGSFIYRKLRDRTPEEMQGPPLLPGGSAYEDNLYPDMPQSLGSPDNSNQNGNGGVTYRVIARGDHNHNQLRSQAQQIAGTGYSSGTIYNTRSVSKIGKEIPEAVMKAFRGD